MQKILLLPQPGLAVKGLAGGKWLRQAVYKLARASKFVLAEAQAERERWVLWLPVLIGAGVWGYFALPLEPGRGWLLATPILTGLGFLPGLRAWRLPTILFLLAALGFNAAQLATWRAMTPLLQRQMFVPDLQGEVVSVEPASNGATVQLAALTIAELTPEQTPAQVRLKLRGGPEDWPAAGSRVGMAALLMPLSEPVAPDAYDFRRQGFFNGIGAQGFVRGNVRVLAAAEPSGLMLWIEGLREAITRRVAARLTGDTGQIATALLNGTQSGISQPVLLDMRNSGLFHILSISGLHLAIVAAFLFVGLRRILALSPYMALHWPIKKIAAIAALLILPFYTLLVGAPVPAVRSGLMTGVVLLAVLAERRALSLRTVALVAAGLLLVVPQAMLGASFQLSFAAVTVMIAGYETLRRYRQPGQRMERGLAGRAVHFLWRHGGGMALTSLLAGVATAPFTLFQFQQANWYGIAANILGIPLTSFIIMPTGFLAYFLMPFGLESPALGLMGWGVERLMDLAAYVGNWPGATLAVTAFPGGAFIWMLLGGLWLCIWQRPWRLLGVLPMLLGIYLAVIAPRPDIVIAADYANWAVRWGDTAWLAQNAKEKDFTLKQWRQQAGNADFLALNDVDAPETLRCDTVGCLYQAKSQRVMFLQDAAGMTEDCAAADLIVTPLWRLPCGNVPIVDGARLKWQGATSVTLHPGAAPEVRSARARWGARPWSPGWRGDAVRLVRETVRTPTADTVASEIKTEQEGEGE